MRKEEDYNEEDYQDKGICVFDNRPHNCSYCGGTITCPVCGSEKKDTIYEPCHEYHTCQKCGKKYYTFNS